MTRQVQYRQALLQRPKRDDSGIPPPKKTTAISRKDDAMTVTGQPLSLDDIKSREDSFAAEIEYSSRQEDKKFDDLTTHEVDSKSSDLEDSENLHVSRVTAYGKYALEASFDGDVSITAQESIVTTQESFQSPPEGLKQRHSQKAGTGRMIADKPIFALVIAIDKYKNKSIPSLEGCGLDGADFVDFLTNTLRVPESRIIQLNNEQATRSAILAAFQRAFIDNDKIEYGDAMVFFYAGHGDRVKAPVGWTANDDMIEMICPFDLETPDDNGVPIPGIPDRTFDSLMRYLASVKGDNILAIFDSCHSGGVARSRRHGTPRQLGTNVPRSPIPATLDEDIQWAGRLDPPGTEGTSRGAKSAISSGFSYSAMRSHVLLAACRANEKALENRVAIKERGASSGPTHRGAKAVPVASTGEPTGTSNRTPTRGMFTLHLLAYLRWAHEKEERLEQLTYARLMDSLLTPDAAKLCGVSSDGQHPLCEGKNRDRLLFSTTELDGEERLFKMRWNKGVLYVVAGEVNGVCKGTRFVIRASRGTRGNHGTILIAEHVDVTKCSVRLVSESLRIKVDSLEEERALLVAWNSEPMKIHTSLPLQVRSPYRHTKVMGREYYDVSLEDGSNGWAVDRFDPLTSRYAEPEMSIPKGVQPAEILNALAHWNFHLYRRSDCLEDIRPQVQLHRLQASSGPRRIRPLLEPAGMNLLEGARAERIRSHPLSTYKIAEEVKEVEIHDMEPYYGLTLVNNTTYDLYPYVFYFDPCTLAIQAWYLPHGSQGSGPLTQKGPDDQPGRLPIGYGDSGTDSIRFSLDPDVKKEAGFLKIFVSTSYVDMRSVQQGDLTNGAERGATKEEISLAGDGWHSSVYVLTCC